MGNRKNVCFCFPSVSDPLSKDRSFYVCRTVQGQVLLWGRKDATFPLGAQVGPDWYCTICTYVLILVPSAAFLVNVAADWGMAMVAPSASISLALLLAYSMTACSDPGIAWRPDEEEANGPDAIPMLECSMCKIMRPRR